MARRRSSPPRMRDALRKARRANGFGTRPWWRVRPASRLRDYPGRDSPELPSCRPTADFSTRNRALAGIRAVVVTVVTHLLGGLAHLLLGDRLAALSFTVFAFHKGRDSTSRYQPWYSNTLRPAFQSV